MNNELKPCPFCGGEPKIVKERRYPNYESNGIDAWRVECRTFDCPIRYANYTYFTRRYKAIEAWNRRADDEED